MYVRLYNRTLQTLKKHNDHFIDRDSNDVLEHPMWHLPASLQCFPTCNAAQPSTTAGSSSQPSITNGGSFGGIAPTGGQYGSVVISAPTLVSSRIRAPD